MMLSKSQSAVVTAELAQRVHARVDTSYATFCVVTCACLTVISLTACVVTIVNSSSLAAEHTRILQECQNQLDISSSTPKHASRNPGSESSQDEGYAFTRLKRKANNGRIKNGKRGAKFCKKVARCSRRTLRELVTRAENLRKDTTPNNHLRVSHFTVDGTEVRGKSVGAFQPTIWEYPHVTKAAVSMGNFLRVQESGMYLVYSSILFNDTKLREIIIIKRNKLDLFKCFDGVDIIGSGMQRLKTCSITGVTHLSKGDELELVNMNPDTKLEVNGASTFIGLVQLHRGH